MAPQIPKHKPFQERVSLFEHACISGIQNTAYSVCVYVHVHAVCQDESVCRISVRRNDRGLQREGL